MSDGILLINRGDKLTAGNDNPGSVEEYKIEPKVIWLWAIESSIGIEVFEETSRVVEKTFIVHVSLFIRLTSVLLHTRRTGQWRPKLG